MILLINIISVDAYAGRRSKYFSVYGQYHFYSDLVNNSDNATKQLESDYSFNIDLRVYRIFILSASVGQAKDGSRKFSGIGFKADLPGFFVLGGNVNDLIRRKKRKGLNTYMHWRTYIIQEEGQGDRSVSDRFALGADIQLYNSVFLNLELGLYSHKGDQFLSPGLGMAVEF